MRNKKNTRFTWLNQRIGADPKVADPDSTFLSPISDTPTAAINT